MPGIVGTGALLLGVEVPITCHFSVGMDAGVRYESKLDPSSDIQKGGNWYGSSYPFPSLKKYNEDSGDRLYCPVTVYAKFRF